MNKKVAMYLLMANMFIIMSGIGLVVPIMPTIVTDFGAGGKTFGFLIATFAFAQFLFSPIAGDLSDRYGRKKAILVGLFLFSVSQFFFAYAGELWMLYVARWIGGMGGAFLIPSIMAFVADITTKEERAKGMGKIGAAMSLGFVVGPGIGGFLAEFGVQVPLIVAGVISALAFFMSIAALKEAGRSTQHMPQKRDSLWKQMAASVQKPYFVLLLMMLTLSFGLMNYQSTISLFTDRKFGFSPADISVLMVTGGLVGVIVQTFVLDRVLKRFGTANVLNSMLVVAALSMVAIIFSTGFVSVLLISIFFFTAASLLRPVINTSVSQMAGNEQGFAAGMNNAYMSIGNMAGPSIAGIMFDVNMVLPYLFGAVIIFITLFISVRWMSSRSESSMTP